jgi:putative ABC transport system permease protein
VAFSAALLVAAGLLIDSVVRIGSEPLGFDPDHLFTTRINLPAERYREPARRIQFYRSIENVASLPGVAGAALSSGFPFSGGPNRELEIGGQPVSAQRRVLEAAVAPECFRVLGIPLVQGRGFTDADAPDSEPVAVVNAALAAQYFGGAAAVGRRIRITEPGVPSHWLTVVGVVGNVKRTSVYREMSWAEPAVVFRPLSQNPGRSLSLAIRTTRGPVGLAEMVHRRIAEIDSGIAIQEVAAVNAWISRELAYPRFRALLFGVFAALALALAAVGVYGVLAQFVAGRQRELAVRIALGAPRGRVLWLIGRYGGAPVVAGLAVGIALSSLAGKALSGLLYGVQPSDFRILAGVSLVFLTVAGIALAVPARRAAQVDPMSVLREE